MRQKLKKVRPASGFSSIFHAILTLALPLLVYVFVRINITQLAVLVVLLAKWRVIAVRPRHWPAYLRANAVDIIVGLSFVVFMTQTSSMTWQLIWTACYIAWSLIIKPINTVLGMSVQAILGQTLGLMALYAEWGGQPLFVLILATWAITYFCARHFFSAFDDGYGKFLGDYWAFFAGSLAWILGHWLLYYGVVAQPTLLLTVLSFGLGSMYYLNSNDKLSSLVRRQIVFVMMAIVVVVIVFSDWSDKVI